MGFFSDLKEDLSQAVSELMVDEEQGAVDVKEEKAENTENAESTEEKELLQLSSYDRTHSKWVHRYSLSDHEAI